MLLKSICPALGTFALAKNGKKTATTRPILGSIPRFSINASSVPLRMDVTTILKST